MYFSITSYATSAYLESMLGKEAGIGDSFFLLIIYNQKSQDTLCKAPQDVCEQYIIFTKLILFKRKQIINT